jgi:predicted CopG family antitoxin
MLKQMTISVEEDVYNTLAPFAARQTLSDYIAHLVRSRNAETALEEGYKAANTDHEQETQEKCSVKPNPWDITARALGYKDHRDYLRTNTPKTLAEAEAQAQALLDDPKHKNFFQRYYGVLEGEEAYGNGTDYQRKMRDEWPD